MKTGKDFSADIAATEAAIASNTILLIGLVLAYPYGELTQLWKLPLLRNEKILLCHVDACIGWFDILPFIKKRLRNSHSILKVDMVLLRFRLMYIKTAMPQKEHRSVVQKSRIETVSVSLYTKWAGTGIYGSPTMTGTVWKQYCRGLGENIAFDW